MDKEQFIIEPIAHVKNDVIQDAYPKQENGKAIWYSGERKVNFEELVSELVFDNKYEDGLIGIEGYSHLTVIFWPNRFDEGRRKAGKTRPMGFKDLPEVGTFALRSPARPNPLLITTVELLSRKGNTLVVKGLDALNGTPIMDIKPYSAGPATEETKRPKWMEDVHKMFVAE